MSEMFVESALGLPLFTSGTSLLFHTFNDPMKVLIVIVFFHGLSVFLVTFSGILRLTGLAPNPQSVRTGAILAKLTFVFLLFAFAALLHFYIHTFNYP